MPNLQQTIVSRKNIAIRLLYAVLYLAVFEIVKLIIQLTVVFQFIYLLITLRHHDPIRKFCNKVATYLYRVTRYLTLNENQRPFPFGDLPKELEQPVERVRFP